MVTKMAVIWSDYSESSGWRSLKSRLSLWIVVIGNNFWKLLVSSGVKATQKRNVRLSVKHDGGSVIVMDCFLALWLHFWTYFFNVIGQLLSALRYKIKILNNLEAICVTSTFEHNKSIDYYHSEKCYLIQVRHKYTIILKLKFKLPFLYLNKLFLSSQVRLLHPRQWQTTKKMNEWINQWMFLFFCWFFFSSGNFCLVFL